MTAEQIAQILSLYTKHGWILRRVLLSDALKKSLGASVENLFAGAEIRASEFDAAWFSRRSKTEQEAWELRRLSQTPFALFETFETDDDEEIRDEALTEIEARMRTQFQGGKPK